MNKVELIEMVIGNTFDIGIMVGETGNKKHQEFTKKREELRKKTIQVMKKELNAIIKLQLKKKKRTAIDDLRDIEQKMSEDMIEVMV